MFLGGAIGVRMNDSQLLAIHGRHPIRILKYPMGTLHLGALVPRHIALEGFAGLPDLVVMVPQPGLELPDLTAQCPAILLLPGLELWGNAAGIPLAVHLEHALHGPFQLLLL